LESAISHANLSNHDPRKSREIFRSGAARLSFRTSVLCAVRNLGEPREASRCF
jgi:hypothetical protein